MKTTEVLKKLKYKSGMEALAINAPAGLSDEFVKAGMHILPGMPKYCFLIMFAPDSKDFLKFINRAVRLADCDGYMWICYPKGASKIKTDLNRDKLWELMRPLDMRPVSLVAIDDTWSAMRFRPESLVKPGESKK